MNRKGENFLSSKKGNSIPSTKEFISRLDQFKNRFEELARAIEGGRVTFFVGSGISSGTPTNIETAKELARKLKDKFGCYDWWQEHFDPLKPKQDTKFFDESLTIPKLEEIAELFLRRSQFKLFINSILEEKLWETKPFNICHTVLSELLIEEICEGVLTTNLDERIEQRHRNITMRSGPNVISHDDFFAEREHRNDIYKIHGCLYKCPTRKYSSIWASSQLRSSCWPSGVNFADNVIKDFSQRHFLVFVGFNTSIEYLKRTLSAIIEANRSTKFYCVLPCDFDSVNPDFKKIINLVAERYVQLNGEHFFSLVRQIVFEKLLNKLFRENVRLKSDKFFGGSTPLWKIHASEFDTEKESLKLEIIREERERFQGFLKQILLEEGYQQKYISFRYHSDHMARLFFWLVLFRFNYTKLTFSTVRSRHLLMHKGNQILNMLIINGDREKPILLILQQLNRKIEEDPEFLYDIRNIFIYDAIEYIPGTIREEAVGSGRLVERKPHTIINASSTTYFVLTDQEMYEFLRNFSLREFKEKLDSLPWRV